MNLSKITQDVLKNFASINQSLFIKKGQTLSTFSTANTIFAEVKVAENFPLDVPIYDLKEFLSIFYLSPDTDIDFKSEHCVFSSADGKIKFAYADPAIVKQPPDIQKLLQQEERLTDQEIVLTSETLTHLQKVQSVLTLTDLEFYSEDGKVKIKGFTKVNPTHSEYSYDLGDYSGAPFKVILNMADMKMLKNDYNVRFYDRFLRFVNEEETVQYFIASKPDSFFSAE